MVSGASVYCQLGLLLWSCGKTEGHSANGMWKRRLLLHGVQGKIKGLRMCIIHVLNDLLIPTSPHTLLSTAS